jgi:DNA adenine methylase
MKSPLRYPGGKTRAIKILADHLPKDTKTLLSPFFGGGSFELSTGLDVKANDLFGPLYTFWSVLKENPEELERRVRALMPVDKETFKRLRTSIMDIHDPVDVATAYYIINRCSFSGSTFCGGFSQEASTGRLNESSLKTLKSVKLDKVEFSNLDCCDFLDAHPAYHGTFVYADPPYYISTYIYGKDGDMHESFDHEKFARVIKGRKGPWLISYNDCEYIRALYSDCTIESVNWSYGMNAKKPSSEILIYTT